MKLKKIKIENFRLLKDFELNLKDDLSLIIGKNNCGKTSILVILNKILNSSKIMWEDVNLSKQRELYENIKDSTKVIDRFESIRLQLFIEYNDNDNYTNIQKFIMDLNPENNIIILEFVVLIDENKISKLQDFILQKNLNDFNSFSKFMKKNFSEFFTLQKYSRRYDPDLQNVTEDKSEQLENKDIQKLIKITGIQADRAVSNNDKNHALSSLTEQYYNIYKLNKKEKNEVFEKLQNAVETADRELYSIYNGKSKDSQDEIGIFSEIINVIRKYGGYDGELQIAIESSISEKNLLSGNTELYYKQGDNSSLPETYNGLGYLNLIGILFEIETKIIELYSDPADINILYIEEPEAHTHPQLQYIFIRNIKEHIRKHRELFLNEKNKSIQVILTSHSSHIVSECNFDDIIYLKREKDFVIAKDFNSLKNEYEGSLDGFKFVKQYLTLNRSELFFADKAICIEGDTERILMPMMMKKIDLEAQEEKETPLLSQNISIIEIGGAYSHIFMPLFKFLGIKLLIITDIDAVEEKKILDKNGKEKITYSSCHPSKATYTSNASIRDFFKDDITSESHIFFETITNKTFNAKEKENIRIAYQISEKGYQASSFEDAFISVNKEFIEKNKDNFIRFGALKFFENIDEFYSFAITKVNKKSAFASSILYYGGKNGEEWKVPQYIKEGLEWLKKS